jgi:hypothetical protein
MVSRSQPRSCARASARAASAASIRARSSADIADWRRLTATMPPAKSSAMTRSATRTTISTTEMLAITGRAYSRAI